MGLIKKQEYVISDLGISIPAAYAKISHMLIDDNGVAHATFNIHQTRENTVNKTPLDRITVSVNIDKTLPIYSQIYTAAKEEIFIDWEDDIVEETVEE